MFFRFATSLIIACSFFTVFSAPVQRLAILRDGYIEGKVEARGARQGNRNAERQVDCAPVTITRTVTVDPPAATLFTPPSNGNNVPAAGNLQPFTGALGGQRAPAVTIGRRGFQVENNASFQALQNALQRSCDVQKNLCANVANSAAGRTSGLTVGQCDQQGDQCRTGIAAAVAAAGSNGSAAQQAPAQNQNSDQNQNNQAANPPTAPASTGNNGNNENTGNASPAAGGNLQPFAGALGGQRAPAVTPGGRGFQVENNASFQALQNALQRSCDVQKNLCANVANSNAGRTSGLTVNQCDAQGDQCCAGIAAAVAASGSNSGGAQQAPAQNQNQNGQVANPPAAPADGNNGNEGNAGGAAAGGNLQPFAGALGGERAPTVTSGGRGFQVEGNASFLDLASALRRSCDVQKNKCTNVANSDAGRASGLTVGQCDQQGDQCRAGI
ncbi:hypothetical protein NLJ89_g8637 [Agrocybe chaxingu]|uniref:Uncharacterized protein n=1 Tax=Agrocybe chaxingu TaxID=84603 RepID=A0A9W8JU16_9AGAR|nr:hypothetical protein NLJ89_g8637 [Agrocybe chaxingu]